MSQDTCLAPDGRVVQQASIHHIPVESSTYDMVWRRDMLNHITDPRAALLECCRVLRPGRLMLLYMVVADDLLEPLEAERMYWALGIVPENMSTDYIEYTCIEAGFRIMTKDVIASELYESDIERGEYDAVDRLLHAARLLRHRHTFRERYGDALYEQALGDGQWPAFIMLGKLLLVAYLLQKVAT